LIEFLQQLINGLSLGAVFALIALGYTMVYGVLRFINFAHGDVFMIGAFFGYYCAPFVAKLVPIPGFLAFLILLIGAMLACGALGVTIEFLAYRPLRNQPKLIVLITAIGVSLFLEYAGQFVFKPDPKAFPELILDRPLVEWRTLSISVNQTLVLVMTLLLLAGLHFIVKKTRIGIAMRAVSNNPQAAALMGINVGRVISFTFGLGSALAGAGGILYAMCYPSIEPLMGIMPGLKAFVAAVLGGIGSLPGAVIGGLLLGTTETFVAASRASTYRDAIAFAVLIAILLIKPSGIMGKSEVEKV
jgi:branched-chain amino acid transport system permease protein